MMELSKLQLSAEESAMVHDSHWLLTKNTIMQKAYELFGEAGGWLRSMLAADVMHADDSPPEEYSGLANNTRLPDELLVQSPKIARGENYGGLPYVMLDYPRYFGKEDVFAIRTMFWWGNFLSVTWHLKGKYAEQYRQPLLMHKNLLGEAGFRVCINEDEWRHDFEADNYIPLSRTSMDEFTSLLSGRSFCKLAVKISLDQWNNAKDKLTEVYTLILEAGGISSRGGEKGL